MGTIKNTVIATIVFDSRKQSCEMTCGFNWSEPSTVNLVQQRIAERFGETVKLEVIDLALDEQDYRGNIKREQISDTGVPHLFLNNHLRIAGDFDIRQLLDAVEVEKEIYGK